MTHQPSLVSVVCIVAFSGCASITSTPPSTGRYLQFRNPLGEFVALQMTLPTSDACAYVLKNFQISDKAKETGSGKFTACTNVSASPALHARAKVFSKQDQFVMDIETVSVGDCQRAVNGILAGAGGEANEVLTPCAEK